jgi:hypothetical protein
MVLPSALHHRRFSTASVTASCAALVISHARLRPRAPPRWQALARLLCSQRSHDATTFRPGRRCSFRTKATTRSAPATSSPLLQGGSPAGRRSHELRTSPALLLLSGWRSLWSLVDPRDRSHHEPDRDALAHGGKAVTLASSPQPSHATPPGQTRSRGAPSLWAGPGSGRCRKQDR